MPLIKCPECAKEISDRADSCPHCGFPISIKKRTVAMTFESVKPSYIIGESGYINVKCPSCGKEISIMDSSLSLTPDGYKLLDDKEGYCECGVSFTEIRKDIRPRCPKCGSYDISIQKEGFDASSACCGAFLLGPLGLLCGAKESNRLNSHCIKCGHKWAVGSA